MGKPGVRLTGPARREKAAAAYRLSVRRVPYTEIAKYLGISRQLVSTLVGEEKDRLYDEKEHADVMFDAIQTYEEVIATAWQRLSTIKSSSLNVISGLLNTIVSAQKAIDNITGVKAPKQHEGKVAHEQDTFDFFSHLPKHLLDELEAVLDELETEEAS